MLIRYKTEAVLKKATKQKQSNGFRMPFYEIINTYVIQSQTLEDQVNVSVYGDNISKILRITSPKNKLEKFLYSKVTNEQDNISKYYIFIDNIKYKINSVTKVRIDVERL